MKYLFTFGVSVLTAVFSPWISNLHRSYSFQTHTAFQVSYSDSASLDSLRSTLLVAPLDTPYKPTRFPYYRHKDRYSDPFSSGKFNSPLLFDLSNTIQTDIEVLPGDSAGYNYRINEKIGDLYYRNPTLLDLEDYSAIRREQDKLNTWREFTGASTDSNATQSNRLLIPKIPVEGKFFNRIFGGDFVEFKPAGFVNLDFAVQRQKVANPQLPIRQQRNTNFLFDPHANISLTGKVGEKMQVSGSFDTKASFQFENNFKLDYTGFEEDIIQKIEFGNVSFPLSTSLIQGAQNLFGVATELKFGHLKVRTIFSNQRAQSEQINLQGGAQRRKFEVAAADYEDNRHFFLAHFFRDRYEQSLSTLPTITSGVQITRLDVYVTNRVNNTTDLRNVLAFSDLGENDARLYNQNLAVNPAFAAAPDNRTNNLSTLVANITDADRASSEVQALNVGFQNGSDFLVLRSARKLSSREYDFNDQLGYISLLTPLRNDEVLAVAYEYIFNGQTFQVGELSDDYNNRDINEIIRLKMLRPNSVRIDLPTWDLMMKNIYSLNANQVTQQNFLLRVIYKDDLTGIDNPNLQEGIRTKDKPLLQILKLDNLNQLNDPQPDGNFDFVEGITIDSRNGRIIFPVLEPFGSDLESQFDAVTETELINRYVFDLLYTNTKSDALQAADKNKFFLSGSFEANASTDVSLPGINISPGSVRVTAGNTPLVEGEQYTVDYSSGRVTITDQSVVNSGKEIKIDYEKADLFNFQTRRLFGTRFDYEINKDIIFGATFMNLSERPVITRNNIADEPVNNTMLGFDINYKSTSRFLTRLVDMLPLIQTKQESNITFTGEYAQLFPGAAPLSGQISYIDDFEGTRTAFNLGRSPQVSWKLGATPQLFPEASSQEQNYAYRRAKIAWYNVDNVFYRQGAGSLAPSTLDTDNHYIRQVSPQEIFPNRSRLTVQTNEIIFDVAFFPQERGPYNYTPNLTTEGLLPNPEQNFGAISRAITSDIDFDNANVEYVEFWMLDPFIQGENGRVLDGRVNRNNTTGGDLYINLGNVSEDVIPDGNHAFENGLDPGGDTTTATRNTWGLVTKQQYLTNAFDNAANARENQDVGLDGLNNESERTFEEFSTFLNNVNNQVTNPTARDAILNDPSGDDFTYYLDYPDNIEILERYKTFNGFENNSPVGSTGAGFAAASNNNPDNEDLNIDNTISDQEGYYQYRVPLRPGELNVGQGYIINSITTSNNVTDEEVTWYLFRIPIREFDNKIGNIDGFKSIRFLRLFMTNFREPVVLRFAQFQIVANQWRTFQGNLNDRSFGLPPEPSDAEFNVSTVNIEENSASDGESIPYTLPPGSIRDRDVTTINNQLLNEQSMRFDVVNLRDKDARAVFRNYNLDFLSYKRLRMFIHADAVNIDINTAESNQVTAFVRLGTDFTDNYYEVEVPLQMTRAGAISEELIWPSANEIDIAFSDLTGAKVERNRQGRSVVIPFQQFVGKYRVTVVGNPDLSAVQIVMIGVRNPDLDQFADLDPNLPALEDRLPKSFRVWVNELRISDFDQTAGWAGLARANIQLADVANITASLRYTTFGFGQLNQKISERARETTIEYDIAAGIALDKFLPKELGLKIPFFVSVEKSRIIPRFNPLNPDITLSDALQGLNKEEESEYRKLVEDIRIRKSFNFTNVQKVRTNPNAKVNIWDIENFSFTYAYSLERNSNSITADYLSTQQRLSAAYTFSRDREPIVPFKNVKFLDSPYLALIKDFNFNLIPNQFSIRGDLDRSFIRTTYRSADLVTSSAPLFQKRFLFNRAYNLQWNLSNSLTFSYNAIANAVIDEPLGELDTEAKRDSVLNNLKRFGRLKNYNQQLSFTYQIPIDKFPLTDWISANASFGTTFQWTAGAVSPTPGGLGQADTLGHVINNARDRGLQSTLDFTKLYKKSKFLNKILTPPRTSNNQKQNTQPKTEEPKDSTKTKSRLGDSKLLQALVRPLLMLQRITGTYTINEQTIFPGFTPTPRFLGLEDGFGAPGYGFALFGSQNPDIKRQAIEGNWVAPSSFQNRPFSQAISQNLTITADLEPLKDFKIQLDASITRQVNYQELFRANEVTGIIETQNPVRSGSYAISTISFLTAFKGDANFDQFVKNRDILLARLRQLDPNPSDTIDYGINSQDILIPAFLAAYTGKDASLIGLSPFPKTPLPNWRIDYTGLSKIKLFKDIFSSVNITHSYASNYSVSNYRTSLEYGADVVGIDGDERDFIPATLTNQQGELIPVYVISQVTISERFSPLLGINVRTKANLTFRLDYNKERDLALNLSNAQVTEINNESFVLSVGYTKANIKLPFRSNGKDVILKNDVDFRLDVTIRDTNQEQKFLPRQDGVETGTPPPTGGNTNVQVRPVISYVVNQQLNIQFYFETNVNTPKVSSSFPRKTSTGGFQIRYNLTQ
ncbi:MAG: cell surface protein SprA [Microscillaceae bacterium]|nr:cell surface protein SprA [Microscillaceae bacterium]